MGADPVAARAIRHGASRAAHSRRQVACRLDQTPHGLIAVSPADLDLDLCLNSGQAFRWTRRAGGTWAGAIGSRALLLRQTRLGLEWWAAPSDGAEADLRHYFALDVSLGALYAHWRAADPGISAVLDHWAGLRVLRQPLPEALIGFICASCNTVTKIARSVTHLAAIAGRRADAPDGTPIYVFPTLERIAATDTADLKRGLWGYRSQYLLETSRRLASEPDLLEAIMASDYRQSRSLLQTLPGIGRKVADCICLFGLWHNEAVPIDVHVCRVVVQRYRGDLRGRSLTDRVYGELSDTVTKRFGPYSGWLQQYFFMESRHRAGG